MFRGSLEGSVSPMTPISSLDAVTMTWLAASRYMERPRQSLELGRSQGRIWWDATPNVRVIG